eukprot:4181671-Alexandrium_andersonii.AAC.1
MLGGAGSGWLSVTALAGPSPPPERADRHRAPPHDLHASDRCASTRAAAQQHTLGGRLFITALAGSGPVPERSLCYRFLSSGSCT